MDNIAGATESIQKQIKSESSEFGCKSIQFDRIIAMKSAHILHNWRTLPTIWKSMIKIISKKCHRSSSIFPFLSLFFRCFLFQSLSWIFVRTKILIFRFKSAMRSNEREKKKKTVKYLLPFIVCSAESIMHIHLACNAPYRLNSFQLNVNILPRFALTYVAKMWIPHGWISAFIRPFFIPSNIIHSFLLFFSSFIRFLLACKLLYSMWPSKFEHIIRMASRFVCADDLFSRAFEFVMNAIAICAMWMNFWCDVIQRTDNNIFQAKI